MQGSGVLSIEPASFIKRVARNLLILLRMKFSFYYAIIQA